MSYTHLSPEERYYIEISLKNEIGLAEIAASLERPQSTISREISRNTLVAEGIGISRRTG